MQITVLGTRGEIEASKPYHSRHSGILIDGKILLDVGEKEFLDYGPKLILITHLHPDHAFFVSKNEDVLKQTKVPIYAPESYKKFRVTKKTKKITFQRYSITPIPTIHSKLVASQAYLIKKQNKTILYTGDMVWIEKKYHRLFKNVDAVITEGSYLRRGGLVRKDKETGKLFGHKGIPDWINLFCDKTPIIIFTHFGSWFFKITAQQARKKIEVLAKDRVQVVTAYDGFSFQIKSGCRTI
jgi:ribonuclease BN (tRNA processing enzyme)